MNDDIITGKRVYDGMYTFTKDCKSIKALETFYEINKETFAKLKALSPSYYEKIIEHMKTMREKIESQTKYFVDVKMIWTKGIEGKDEEQVIANTKDIFWEEFGIALEDNHIKVVGKSDEK